MEIARKNPDALMDIHDEIMFGKEAYQSLAEMMDKANMRILAACGYAYQEWSNAQVRESKEAMS